MRPCTCTTRSCWMERMEPTGKSWFSLLTASTTCCAVMPSDSMACGLRYKLISRLVPPTSNTEPTPRTFSSLFFSTWSAQLVISTWVSGLTPAGKEAKSVTTANDQIGRLDGSNLNMRDSLTSVRKNGCTLETFSRTSSAALRPLIFNWNSTITTDKPS